MGQEFLLFLAVESSTAGLFVSSWASFLFQAVASYRLAWVSKQLSDSRHLLKKDGRWGFSLTILWIKIYYNAKTIFPVVSWFFPYRPSFLMLMLSCPLAAPGRPVICEGFCLQQRSSCLSVVIISESSSDLMWKLALSLFLLEGQYWDKGIHKHKHILCSLTPGRHPKQTFV